MERTKFSSGRIPLKILRVSAYEKSNKIYLKIILKNSIQRQSAFSIRAASCNHSEKEVNAIRPPTVIYNTNNMLEVRQKNKNQEYLPLADKLAMIIKTSKKINTPLTRIKMWADDIRKLSEIGGVEIDRIEKALDWYEDNIGGQFIPIIESAGALRNKFQNIEAAMEREKNPYSNKPKSVYDGNIRYDLCPDGRYRHPTSGDVYIP